ncbi:hypothetical protein BROUX41_003610 [Berkeleyomyces rouxiae]|uniref:uncharacterized protein n=1 Tax=Berkeleyomyces rouxiae TaxID=2035830 RepID=UPI003B82968A
MAASDEHEGASVQEQLVEACRRNNTELLEELLETIGSEAEISRLLNDTTTVMGDHLYHVAAAQGHYDVIDMLLDQPNFECDPLNRTGDTPLHVAIHWLNSEPPAQRPFGAELVKMMLEAGSNSRLRNAAGLTAVQLVDPANAPLRDLIREHEYTELNQGDFVAVDNDPSPPPGADKSARKNKTAKDERPRAPQDNDADEFSGSDEEERAEWVRRKAQR